jgi:flagella basal body P-ring formation protein FlgA
MTIRQSHSRISAAVALGVALFGFATPGHAVDLDRKPMLKANVIVRSDIVTVADFFEGAGTVGSTAIFRSPDLGKTGTVSAAKVIVAAKAAGLFDATAGSIVDVTVTHEARPITQEQMQRLISDAALRQSDIAEGSELQISFDQPFETHKVDANSGNPVHLDGLTYSPVTGRFEAVVIFDMGTGVNRERIRGSAIEMVPTVNLTRAINRGDVVSSEDLTVTKQPRRVVGSARQVEPDQIIGMAAKRALRPDQQLSLADFGPPILVARGDTVTLVYEMPGIQLTARGTAQENGTKGEAVTVVNPTSKRIVHGVVVGQGKVQVAGGILTASADDTASTGALNGRQQK